MPLPAPLLRANPSAHKNIFGHILILAGSRRMLGAGCLSALAALRAGAGLVTFGIPEDLNASAHKKLSNEIMTLPLKETKEGSIAASAFTQIKKTLPSYQAVALGPGLGQNAGTQKFILNIIKETPSPLVIDADGLNALSKQMPVLHQRKSPTVLTPHPGEMARLTGKTKAFIQKNRRQAAHLLAREFSCTVLLKGDKTIVASEKHSYTNTTGNAGLATAGSGDVLTGMIAALLGQGLSAFEAAKWGAFLHGRAADLAVKRIPKVSLIASDIIDYIPAAIKKTEKRQ